MGAKWQRDMTGQSKPSTKVPAFQQPVRPGKRKLVWTKDQQDQPTVSAGHSNGHPHSGPPAPVDQYDHFEKRRRLNQDLHTSQNVLQHKHVARQQPPHAAPASQKQAADTVPAASAGLKQAPGSMQQAPPARQDPAAVLAQQQKAAELAELKRRIKQEEDALIRQKKQKVAMAEQQAHEQRHEQNKRRERLEAGFSQAFKRAKEVADAELAQRKTPPKQASEEEVQRVLAAKTDYECLQIPAGSDAVTIKRKYRELAVALHPDKCKAEGATDAFQRLVKAYQNTLKLARQV